MLFPFLSTRRGVSRVVVTGAGVVSPLGLGWDKNAEGFRTGRRAFRPVTRFGISTQRATMAAEVDLPRSLPATRLTARQETRLDHAARMLLFAAHEAWTQSGWNGASESIPLVLGTTSGGMSLGEEFYRHAMRALGDRRQPTRVTHYQPQRQALDLADAFGFEGPVTIIANACASGANALGHAFDLVRSGRSTRALTGGYDALSELVFSGFDSLQALSTTSCRPFDTHRDGLALGEGAAVFCFESLESAATRGAEVLCEIVGYSATTDTHHLTQPHPAGEAAFQSMTAACLQAQVGPSEIGYVNAHGTGTPANDGAEAAAITRWAGSRAATLPVSSTKAGIGHLLGAAGAVEAAVCMMAMRGRWLPPELEVGTLDPACGFPVVDQPTSSAYDYALSNSFGFGGANASLLFRRFA